MYSVYALAYLVSPSNNYLDEKSMISQGHSQLFCTDRGPKCHIASPINNPTLLTRGSGGRHVPPEKFCILRPQKHCFLDSERKFLIIPMPNFSSILQTFKTGEVI